MSPTLVPRVALACVAALLVVFGLFRIDPIDVPEHLAVGRLIWESGSPMTTNALSWTFPDYPNDQQYPLYQVLIHLLAEHLGFWSLSLFCCATWTAAVVAWGAWGTDRSLDRAASTVFIWFLAVLGVQRHLVARPEVFTLLGLALLLLAFDHWRRTQRRAPLVAMVATLWVMVNTHQMYVLGILLMAGFVVHVALSRALPADRFDTTDAALPVQPLLITLAAGVAALALSPLGPRAWIAPWALVTTVTELGASTSAVAESSELRPIWTDPIGAPVTVLLLGVVAVQAWRARGRWQVLELGVLAMGVGLVAIALRGIPFFALAAATVAVRWDARAREPLVPAGSLVPLVAAGTTVVLAGALAVSLLTPRPHTYLKRQYGIGQSVGEWADTTISFLTENPPPGEMLNIGWVAANYLNYGVFPTKRVFVDGRWEAYPKPFLDACMEMQRDQQVLDDLIAEWSPGFVVAEMRDPEQQDRIATLVERGWALVFVDSITAVAVRPHEQASAYIARHRLDPPLVDPPDWLPDHPVLHAQQQIRVASLLRRLGARAEAEALLERARAHADHPAVIADLARFE